MFESRSISPHTIIVVALLLIPMAVRTTSPSNPYHDFNVSGRIERVGGGALQNYTIALAVRGRAQPGEYTLLREGSRPFALTSESGSFHLSASLYDYIGADDADSLAVAVLVPGDEFIRDDSFARRSVRPTEDRRSYSTESDGCCESPTEGVNTVGYIYHYPDQVVLIP
jgi:hypothetical protein